MGSWTNATPADEGLTTPAGVILHPQRLDGVLHRSLHRPNERLSTLVERYWILQWSLPAASRFSSSLVPRFGCDLSLEGGRTRPGVASGEPVVTGVPTHRFDVDVAGSGWVFGAKFHPGALAAVSRVSARDLVDRIVPAADVLAAEVAAAFRPHASLEPDERVAVADDALAPLLERIEPGWTAARAAVEAVHSDRSIASVAELADRTTSSVRALQRLFARFVGPTPKQVITRCRLHDVVAELHADTREPLADIAHRLGFYDQAHFTREFTAFVGVPPGTYRAERLMPD